MGFFISPNETMHFKAFQHSLYWKSRVDGDGRVLLQPVNTIGRVIDRITTQLQMSTPQLPDAEPVYLIELCLLKTYLYKHVEMEQQHRKCSHLSGIS